MLLVVAGLMLVVARRSADQGTVPSEPGSQAQRSAGVYASTVRAQDGSIDIDGTLNAVRDLGADRYYFLVKDGGSKPRAAGTPTGNDWAQLPAFAEAAQAAGVDVVVYLVPPSESARNTYLPHGWDYTAWARSVAALAAVHPAIIGMAIDDFGANTDLRLPVAGRVQFNPTLVQSMRTALTASGRNLRLYAVLYGQDFYGRTAVIGRFRPYLDGIIYPFAGPRQIEHAPQNTTDPSGVGQTSRLVRRLSTCDGDGSCWQAWFDAPATNATDMQASASYGDLPAGRGRDLSFVVTDSRDARLRETYSISARVGGHDLHLTRTDRADGYTQYSAPVPDGAVGDVALTVTRPRTASTLTVVVQHVAVRDADGDEPLRARQARGGSGAASSVVEPLETVLMIYCAPLGIELGNPAAASPTYVRAVAAAAGPLLRDDTLDGVVAYLPALSDERGRGDSHRPAVSDLFHGV